MWAPAPACFSPSSWGLSGKRVHLPRRQISAAEGDGFEADIPLSDERIGVALNERISRVFECGAGVPALMRALIGKLILAGVLCAGACTLHPSKTSPLSPLASNGVLHLKMNHIGRENLFFGRWTAPRLGRDRKFFRSPLKPGSGLLFDMLKREPVIIEASFPEVIPSLKVQVNEVAFPVKSRRFRRLIPADNVREGSNRLSFLFSSADRIAVQEVSIYPRRFQKMKKRINRETDFLTPVKFHYYINPRQNACLVLSYTFRGGGAVKGHVRMLSEKKRKDFELPVDNRREIRIPMLDDSLHHIEIAIPEIPSQYIRLEKSRLIEDETGHPGYGRPGEAADGKSILMILLDAARADHMSCYGYHRKTTPAIDSLAADGFLFGDVLSEAAYTLASTGTLLTGLPPDFHGVVSAFYSSLGEEVVTFPELIRDKGYMTAAVSSNPFFGKTYNYNQGFARFIELYRDKKIVGAEDFIAPFEKLMSDAGQQPFFLYLHIREPHAPYAMPKPYFGRYQKRFETPGKAFHEEISRILEEKNLSPPDIELITDVYDENLAYADSMVGAIMDVLHETGLSKNTITIIISDHGEGLGEHGLIGHNVVLHREGIQIPLIIDLPGSDEPGRRIDNPAITSDLIVTLCDLLGVVYPYAGLTRGRNLFRLPDKRTRISRSTVMSSHYSGYAVDSFPYRAVAFPDMGRLNVDVYDIEKDPGAVRTLKAHALPEKALTHFLNRFLEDASLGYRRVDTPKLSPEEREKLEALGYIKVQ